MSKHGVFKDENYLPDGYVAAKRINCLDYDHDTLHAIINEHCIVKGQPIVVSNMNKSPNWDSRIFTLNKLKEYRGDLEITLTSHTGRKHTELLGDYIQTLQKVHKLNSLDQFGPEPRKRTERHLGDDIAPNQYNIDSDHTFIKKPAIDPSSPSIKEYKELDFSPEGMYAKDISCSKEHQQAINKLIPEYLLPHGNNDLFGVLPPRFQAENLMCYLAQNKTGTPMHRDLCGTMGHNIMTMASPGGYAEWYIVVNEDREKLATVMKPRRDKECSKKDDKSITKSSFMESERGWLYRNHLKDSDLIPQVILQEPGDLVIIPSRAYHQVRNVGISVKIAWNRITAQTLHNAFEDQLQLYQIICRPEVFKCKAIVHFTLIAWHKQLTEAISSETKSINDIPAMKYGRNKFIKDSNMLLDVYLHKVLYPEALSTEDEKDILLDPSEDFSSVKCDFCHGDVFHRYYDCEICDNYDLCMKCYLVGRSCYHVNDMKMRQSDIPFSTFIDLYKQFISDANFILKEKVFKDLSECLNSSQLEKSPSLATICRRIERYRRIRGDQLNILKCIHCLQDSTVSSLAEKSIGLVSVFKRSPCKGFIKTTANSNIDIFVCKICTEKCVSCEPLVESENAMKDYSIVYYAQPTVDERNKGSFFDIGLEKSCDYPDVSLPSRNEEKPKEKTKLKKKKKEIDEDFTIEEDSEMETDEDTESDQNTENDQDIDEMEVGEEEETEEEEEYSDDLLLKKKKPARSKKYLNKKKRDNFIEQKIAPRRDMILERVMKPASTTTLEKIQDQEKLAIKMMHYSLMSQIRTPTHDREIAKEKALAQERLANQRFILPIRRPRAKRRLSSTQNEEKAATELNCDDQFRSMVAAIQRQQELKSASLPNPPPTDILGIDSTSSARPLSNSNINDILENKKTAEEVLVETAMRLVKEPATPATTVPSCQSSKKTKN